MSFVLEKTLSLRSVYSPFDVEFIFKAKSSQVCVFSFIPVDLTASKLMMATWCCCDVTVAPPLRFRRLRHWSHIATPIRQAVTSDAATITPTNSPEKKKNRESVLCLFFAKIGSLITHTHLCSVGREQLMMWSLPVLWLLERRLLTAVI